VSTFIENFPSLSESVNVLVLSEDISITEFFGPVPSINKVFLFVVGGSEESTGASSLKVCVDLTMNSPISPQRRKSDIIKSIAANVDSRDFGDCEEESVVGGAGGF
jgi:hypothetical protein